MATLRDMGLAPRAAEAPTSTLRGLGLTPNVAPDVGAIEDQAEAASMTQLGLGFKAGRLNTDANYQRAEQSRLRASGDTAGADQAGLRADAISERAGRFAPAEQDVTALDWQPGKILDYGLGAVGQGAASMVDPVAIGVGANALGGAVGMIPHPAAKLASGALRYGGMAAGYGVNALQGKGEFYGDALRDPETMRTKTAQEIDNAGNFSGAVSGAMDSLLTGSVASRLTGRPLTKALGSMGFVPRVGLDMGGEAVTETLQGEVKRGTLGYLNPERDTSGDTDARWNDAVGGALGAGPFSAASQLAAGGRKRLDVVDDLSNDVSGKAGKPAAPGAPAAPPKDETLAQSFARGAAARRMPTPAEEAWRETLSGEADGLHMDAQIDAQHAGLVKELGARAAKGDAVAKQHLDTLNATDMADPVGRYDSTARDAARDHLIGDGTSPASDDLLIAAYAGRKLNQQVPHDDLGGGKVTGGGDNVGGGKMGPSVTEATRAARAAHDQRIKLTTSILRDAVPENRPKAVQLRGVAAELAAELVEFGAKSLAKPSRGDVARAGRLGRQVVALYGAQRAEAVLDAAAKAAGIEGSALYKGLRGHVILAADQGAYQDKDKLDRATAADQLVAVVPPRAQNILRSAGMDLTTPEGKAELLDRVEGFFDSGNDAALGGPVSTKFAQLFGKAGVEAMREVMGQRILGRVQQDFDETENEALESGKTAAAKDSDDVAEGAEEGADRERQNAEKNIENAPGARDYTFFGGRGASGAEGKHPFAADAKNGNLPGLMRLDSADKTTGINSLENLKEKLFAKLGGHGLKGAKVYRLVKLLAAGQAGPPQPIGDELGDREADADSVNPGDLAVGGTRIRTTSAKEVMDHHKVSPTERVEVMRNYLARMKGGKVVLTRDDPTIQQLQTTDRKIAKLEKTTPKERVLAVGPDGALTKDNPAYAALRDLKGMREETASALAAKIGVEYREGMTLAQMADAYFSDAYLVVAEQMAERDQLRVTRPEFVEWARLGARYLKRTDLAGSEARDEARKAGKSKEQINAAGEAAINKMAADMNLLRFKSSSAVADDGIALIPANELAAWVYENRTDHKEKGYNSIEARALAHREAIVEGVAALVADGFADELPYMLNEAGKRESFEQGFPPSLRLGGVAQADLDAEKARRQDKYQEVEGPPAAEALVRQEQNAKDEEPVRNTDADELVDEGKRAKPVHQVLSDEGEDLVGPRDPLAVTTIKDKAQFWDAPQAPTFDAARTAAISTNAEARLNPEVANPFTGELKAAKPARIGSYPTAPETVDTRTDDPSRTPLDAERKQTSGVPTDRTDLRNRNSTMDAALDSIDALTPMNAMRKAHDVARSILGVMSQGVEVVNGKLRPLEGAVPADPRSGFQRMQRLVASLRAAQFRKADDLRPVGGKQYAAPLAHILTPDNIAWMVSLSKNPKKAKADLELMRSETADSLTKEGGLSQSDKTTLARLLTGNEKLSSMKVAEALEKLAWPARMERKAAKDKADREAAETAAKIAKKRAGPTEAVTPKTEPAAIPAPSAPVAETRKLNQQTASVKPTFSTDAQVDEAKAYIAKVLGPAVTVETGKLMGAMGEWIEANNLIKLSLSAGPMLLSVAHHEALHGLFSRLVKNSPDAAKALTGAMSSPRIQARLNDLLAAHPDALAKIQGDTDLAREERVAYAYQFWAAGELDVDKPATTLFAKLRRLLRKVFGMVRESETALDIMTAFHDGKLAEPSAAGKVIADIMARQTWNDDVKRRFDKQIQHIHSAVAVSNDVLLKSESASVRALATAFFTNPGRAGDGQASEGYLNARTRVVRQYTNFLYKIVKGLNEKQMEQAVVHMQEKTPLADIVSPTLRDAVKGLRALTKRYYNYATEGQDTGGPGLKLEFLGEDHYPRVWDLAQLVAKRAEFIAMVMQPKYAKVMASATAIANANVTVQRTTEDVAALMHEHLVEKNGVDDKGVESSQDVILSPFFASQKERSFKWLDDADVQPFLDKDLVGTMSRYLHQGIRAAEYARRFGNGGSRLRELTQMIGDPLLSGGKVNEHGLFAKELYAAAKAAGVGESDAWVARRMDDIRKSVQAHEGSLGSDISPTWRKFSSAAMAYQNLRLLPLSLFAAFADPLSIAARGPGLSAAYDAFMTGLGDVWKRWKDAASDMPAERVRSEWDEMAEAVGAVDSHMFLEQIGKAHTSEFMTDFARKSNRWLFMANGLTAWDRSMRVSATKYAALFLQSHKSLPDSKHSARWLNELGLTPADITLDADGKLVYDRHTIAATKGIDLKQATDEAEKIHYAITRWVEGAVLTPTAAQRPTWASDPRYAVLFHLKQFTYSFQDTVLKRAANEAREGNMNPIGALAAAVPTMIVSDIFKGFVQGGGSLPAYMKGWSLGDHVLHGVSRAGLGGTSELAIDGLRDPFSLLGPTVDQAATVVGNPGDLGANVVNAIPGVRMFKGALDIGRTA